MRVCIVGASGKLGRYMVQHALDRGYEVVGVCRAKSVGKLDGFKGRMTVFPGATDDRGVIERAVAGCDGVLTVLAPWGVRQYSSGTAQAVLDFAPPEARLIFSCGWHITRDGKDVYSRKLRFIVKVFGVLARLLRFAELDDQVEACRRIFASDRRWTVVRGSDRAQHILGLAAGRDGQQHVVRRAYRAHLLGEDLFVVEVIRDRGECRGVGGERECRQTRPLALEGHATCIASDRIEPNSLCLSDDFPMRGRLDCTWPETSL